VWNAFDCSCKGDSHKPAATTALENHTNHHVEGSNLMKRVMLITGLIILAATTIALVPKKAMAGAGDDLYACYSICADQLKRDEALCREQYYRDIPTPFDLEPSHLGALVACLRYSPWPAACAGIFIGNQLADTAFQNWLVWKRLLNDCQANARNRLPHLVR
jgi:hypothetical protein